MRVSWVGILLVVMGGWWLLGELGYVTFEWRFIGPLALVLFGLSMLVGRARCYGWRHEEGPFVEPPRPPQ